MVSTPFWTAAKQGDGPHPEAREFPSAYGYNTLLLDHDGAAVRAGQLAVGESLNISADVDAYAASRDPHAHRPLLTTTRTSPAASASTATPRTPKPCFSASAPRCTACAGRGATVPGGSTPRASFCEVASAAAACMAVDQRGNFGGGLRSPVRVGVVAEECCKDGEKGSGLAVVLIRQDTRVFGAVWGQSSRACPRTKRFSSGSVNMSRDRPETVGCVGFGHACLCISKREREGPRF